MIKGGGGFTSSVQRNDTTVYLTASDAKQVSEKAKSMNGEVKRKETIALLDRIRTIAESGAESMMLEHAIDPLIEARLKTLGYVVRKQYGDQRDPYTSTIISW